MYFLQLSMSTNKFYTYIIYTAHYTTYLLCKKVKWLELDRVLLTLVHGMNAYDPAKFSISVVCESGNHRLFHVPHIEARWWWWWGPSLLSLLVFQNKYTKDLKFIFTRLIYTYNHQTTLSVILSIFMLFPFQKRNGKQLARRKFIFLVTDTQLTTMQCH